MEQTNGFINGLLHPVVLTVLFVFLSAVVAAFIKGRKRDKCLKAFGGFMITLEDAGGKAAWGKLRVEATGLELRYRRPFTNDNGHTESSMMLYKYEYGSIGALIRYHDRLDEAGRKRRDAELERVYHPAWWRRLRRRLMNILRTIRDAIMEVSNVLLAQAKKTTVAGGLLSTQEKYVSQMQNEVLGSVDTAYEPLLEKYIGHRVVAEFLYKETPVELAGVLKDYTADFIELLDVQYGFTDGTPMKKADIILPRKRAVIRHLAE